MTLKTLWLAAALAGGIACAQTPPDNAAPGSGGPPPGAGGHGAGNAEWKARREAMLNACGADIKSLCADAPEHGVMRCLHENADKVSASCKAAMPQRHRPAAAPPAQGS